MGGMEGPQGTVQVQGFQEGGEMAGLVVLDVDLEVVQEAPAVFGDAEEVDPGAVGAAGSAGGIAVYGHRPEPGGGPRFCLLSGAPGPVVAHGGRGPAAGAPAARARAAEGSRHSP